MKTNSLKPTPSSRFNVRSARFTLTLLSVFCFLLFVVSASAATHYVSLESPNPTPPYTNWATAATTIQEAVDAAVAGETVLVTNGVYAAGEREAFVLDTNQEPPQWVSEGLSRVVVTNAVRLESVNGPLVTTIKGGERNEDGWVTNGVRCVFLGTNAVLSGFTLTNGVSEDGGGLYCESGAAVVSNCVLTGNWAAGEGGGNGGGAYGGTLYDCTLTGNLADVGPGDGGHGGGAYGSTLYNCTLVGNLAYGYLLYWGGGGGGGGAYGCTLYNCALTSNSVPTGYHAWSSGGGAFGCTLYNCTLTGNLASYSGGGAYESTLYNCTLISNSVPTGYFDSSSGGGACACTLYNCIVYFNTAANSANHSAGVLDYCCTTPLPTNGVGNVDADPRFVDYANGNLRLLPDSPCINAGNNDYGTWSTDLDGHPRISGGIVDMGAYEFVFTPSMEVARLILLVNDADLGAKNKQPLLAILSAALASFERSNLHSGANQLHAFQNQVRAQVARTDAALANELINAAQQIIEEVTNH